MPSESPTMQAIVRTATGVELQRIPRPRIRGDFEVRVRVARAGLCRTDLHVAFGRLACSTPRVLGHEVSGTVLDVGARVSCVAKGARVALEPMLACGVCPGCDRGEGCLAPRMIGVDLDGGFAEELLVPEVAVHRVYDAMSFQRAAYVEPVAATLSVIAAGVSRDALGAVVGRGRIAELTRRVLEARGFAGVTVREPEELESAEGQLAWAIETTGSASGLAAAMRALRRGGTLIIKSRPPAPVPVDLALAVRRDLHMRAVGYAPFSEAIDLLACPGFLVEDLLGDSYPLSAYAEVFEGAERGEATKVFFAPNAESD